MAKKGNLYGKKKEKVSLICTVFNEEKNISLFINSIISQTKKPEEFIIVDGGSTDKTYDLMKKIHKKKKWIKIFQVKGANISRGRNYAIKKAKNEILLICDAGGKYKEDWIEKMVAGFNGQVSFGMDQPLIRSEFQKTLAKRILHKNVPGSSRNMILLKSIWAEVGGYPEDMERAEDTLFDERIKYKGYSIGRITDAICFWEMRKNLEEVKKQFYAYGYWDGVLQRKHNLLPKKYRVYIPLLILLVPFYPILWVFSRFSLPFRIDFVRRFAYLRGFMDGLFNRSPLHSR